MKAIVCRRYGPPDVLELVELPKPAPRDREVLIRVRATTVTAGDWRTRSLDVPRGFGLVSRLALGVSRPRQPILGMELAGDVEAVGKDVRAFRPGDAVFAYGSACYVEYRCVREDGLLAPKPAALSYEEAAALSFGGTTALDFFRRGRLRRGDRVLVNGASGGVGTAAVQLARHLGAEVTAVCSTGNVELVRGLGAHRVIDYRREDFTRSGEAWDVVLDAAGTAPFSRSGASLRPGGRLLVVLGTLGDNLRAPWISMTSGKRVVAGVARARAEDLRLLASLAGAGELRPVIDRSYPLERMRDAHAYVDAGHKRGNVVVTVGA